VIVTANHFWVDGAVGVVVAAVAAYGAHRILGRARPEAWAWQTGSGHEPAGTGLGAEAPA